MSLRIDAAPLIAVNTTDYGSDGFVFHTYNLTKPYQNVMVSVYPASVNESLNVYVQFDEQPTVNDHEFHFVVPGNPNATADLAASDDEYELAHMLSIDSDNLTSLNGSVIHVAVSKAGARFSAIDRRIRTL